MGVRRRRRRLVRGLGPVLAHERREQHVLLARVLRQRPLDVGFRLLGIVLGVKACEAGLE